MNKYSNQVRELLSGMELLEVKAGEGGIYIKPSRLQLSLNCEESGNCLPLTLSASCSSGKICGKGCVTCATCSSGVSGK